MTDDGYHRSRMPFDPRRRVLWQTLVKHVFQPRIAADAVVLELGAGSGRYSRMLAARGLRVIAAEPDLVLAEKLAQNLRGCDGAEIGRSRRVDRDERGHQSRRRSQNPSERAREVVEYDSETAIRHRHHLKEWKGSGVRVMERTRRRTRVRSARRGMTSSDL